MDTKSLDRLQRLEREVIALQEERERLRLWISRWQSLMQEASFGLVVYAPDGSIREASRGMQKLFGLSEPETSEALRVYNVLEDPELREKGVDQLVRAAFAGEQVTLPPICYELETPLEKKKTVRWVEASFCPLFDEAGKVREVVAIQIDTTPLMRVEEELRASQDEVTEQVRELDQLYATAPVGFALLDTDLRYLRINDRLAAMNGVPAAEHLGRTLDEVLPEVAADFEPALRRVIEGGELEVQRYRGASADRPEAERDWLLTLYPLKTSQGTVRGVGVIVQDITEIERAEKALLEVQQRLQVVVEGADLVLWAVDRKGLFTLSEGRALRSLGLSPGEVVGDSVFELYAENPTIIESVRRALQGESVSEVVEIGDLAFDCRFIPLRDDSGALAGATGVAMDVTSRRRAFDALRESEQRFRDIAENIREVFWLYDSAERRVAYLSPAFEAVWGRPTSEVYDDVDLWFGCVHAEDREIVERALARVADTGHCEPVEYRIVRPDGSTRWILDRGFAVYDEQGELQRIAGLAEDITERRRVEKEQRRFEDRMQQAQRLESLGVLAGGVAHDFNNLMMGVLGNAELALEELPAESPGREHVKKVRTAALRASELADQMLAYSGKGRFRIEPVDLNQIVREMRELLGSVIPKRVQLSLELAPDLPTIKADASQMRQIVMNLITNASEAIGAAEGQIRLRTSTLDADDQYLSQCEPGGDMSAGSYVVLEVSDTGRGIDDELRAKVLEPFFTTKFRGRGLGLAAVLGIVRRHGGALRLASEIDAGTTFSILLPLFTGPEVVASRAPDLEEAVADTGTILVIDDDASVRSLARAMLERVGYAVLTAADGQEGVELFRSRAQEIDLVLLDMTMPGLDGKEAYRELSRIRPDVRVVLASGYSEEDVTAQVGQGSPLAFVHKPYLLAELLKSVRSTLARG